MPVRNSLRSVRPASFDAAQDRPFDFAQDRPAERRCIPGFDRLSPNGGGACIGRRRASGRRLFPFVVSLSNHERAQGIRTVLGVAP